VGYLTQSPSLLEVRVEQALVLVRLVVELRRANCREQQLASPWTERD
jgi:hypothetical protein